MPALARRARWKGALAVLAAGALTAGLATVPSPASAATPTSLQITSTGLPAGAVKHVWLIILENKSYDATFTGLNKNSYLWRTLPQQGVLLKNYYGTGHYSQDNYVSMVSGQAPQQDMQSDCDVAANDFSSNALVSASGTVATNPDYGQAVSAAGPNAPDGKNGCVYPSAVPTLFNQLDAAGKSWKGYAQDLGAQPGREDGPCGYPGTATNRPDAALDPAASATPTSTAHSDSTQINRPQAYPGVRSFTGVQAAGNDAAGNPGAQEDGYVAKHFPFPWFHSLLDGTTAPVGGGSDCDAHHIANLDSPTTGLWHDLQSEATTPAFSWITPNNCSDAHDAVCKGNNLSGAFAADGSPKYTDVARPYDPRSAAPVNYTGGLYASDLFLRWYIPLIEQSAAFKDGGLIDVTFDEANPPFANSSFNNANDPAFAPNATNGDSAFAADGGRVLPGVSAAAGLGSYLAADAAGQNIDGRDLAYEPAGPNTPLTRMPDGTPNPGPGFNGFINRKPSGGRTDGASASVGVSANDPSVVLDNSITPGDRNRQVTGAGVPAGAPCPCYVGHVSDTGPLFPAQSVSLTGGSISPAASAVAGSFVLVDAAGNPVTTTGPVSAVALAAHSAQSDPLYDRYDLTPGGGNTGSVLISPFIKPGSVSNTYYNHYSWLRTMEDIFSVSSGTATAPLNPGAGSITAGLDGAGHLGYAAQAGLRTFGGDVFTNGPAAPASTSRPTTAGPNRVGSVQTCSPGSWTGAPAFSYAWLRDGTQVATGAAYRISGRDYRHTLTCEVTATNGAGSASAASAALAPAVGPRVAVRRTPVSRNRGAVFSLRGLVTAPATDALAYQWLRDGRAITGATRASYLAHRSDRGHLLSCLVQLRSTGYTPGSVVSTAARVK